MKNHLFNMNISQNITKWFLNFCLSAFLKASVCSCQILPWMAFAIVGTVDRHVGKSFNLSLNFSNIPLTVEKVITMTRVCSFGNNMLKQGREDVESNDSTFLQEFHKMLQK